MSGRIALMVRGLPSIPVDEIPTRFNKYYSKPKAQVFHSSESFPTGSSDSFGNIVFTNKAGGIAGGGGLTKDSIRDLRKLEKDFNSYIADNPGIYTNTPTTASRAKLYRRQGFQGEGFQVLDARRIAEDDVPYVKALDPGMLDSKVNEVLGNTKSSGFFKMPDGTIRSLERFNKYGAIKEVMSGKYSEDILERMLNENLNYSSPALQERKRRSLINEQILLQERERQSFINQQNLNYDRQYRPQVRIPWQESQGLIPRITLN